MQQSDNLTIGVVTYRRPQELRRLLDTLELNEPAAPVVLVVDNDPEGSARMVAEGAADRVRYVHEPVAGTSHARNRLMDACTTRWLASIDDDEVPEPGWSAALLETAQLTGAALVAGPVLTEFGTRPSDWVQRSGIFDRPSAPDGSPLRWIRGGNVLFDLDQVKPTGLRYDPAFNKGGQDIRFSVQLAMAGLDMVWTTRAVVVEHVTGERLTKQWVRERWAKAYANHWRARVKSNESSIAQLALRGGAKPLSAMWQLVGKRSVIAAEREVAQAKGAVRALRSVLVEDRSK